MEKDEIFSEISIFEQNGSADIEINSNCDSCFDCDGNPCDDVDK